MPFNLATLFVTIKGDDDPLQKQINGVRSQLSAVGVMLGTAAGNLLSSTLQRGASAMSSFFAGGISGAAELQDTMSAAQAVFGGSASKIFAFADEMAAKFGKVKGETIEASLSFSQMFKAAGQSSDKATEMGMTMAKLGMDLASFKGGSATSKDAFDALQGSLQGNFQGNLDRYNTFLTMAAVNQEAVRMGLARSAAQVDESAKKMATYSLIMKMTTDQQGDMARTADQTHNQQEKLAGTITNLSVSIGTALLPAFTQVVSAGANLASGLASAFEANKGTLAAFVDIAFSYFDTLITGYGNLGATIASTWSGIFGGIERATGAFSGFASFVSVIIDTVGVTFRNLPKFFELAALELTQVFLDINAYFAAFAANAGLVAGYLAGNWVDLLRDAFTGVQTMFSNLASNLSVAWQSFLDFVRTGKLEFDFKPLLDGFVATAAAMPEMVGPKFTSIKDQIDEKLAEIGKAEADRDRRLSDAKAKRDAVAAPPGGPAAAAKAAADKQEKFKSQSLDSEAFYDTLRSAALSAKDDTAKEQLAAQKRTADNTQKIADVIGRGMPTRLA